MVRKKCELFDIG